MKNVLYKNNNLNFERECSTQGICKRVEPVFSLKEVTLFGLKVLSKHQNQQNK